MVFALVGAQGHSGILSEPNDVLLRLPQVKKYRETLELAGIDPVAGWNRRLQVVVAPTGEAARFLAATEGEGSAWITRTEAEVLIAFLNEWLTQTPPGG
jgi:hypothetical protein